VRAADAGWCFLAVVVVGLVFTGTGAPVVRVRTCLAVVFVFTLAIPSLCCLVAVSCWQAPRAGASRSLKQRAVRGAPGQCFGLALEGECARPTGTGITACWGDSSARSWGLGGQARSWSVVWVSLLHLAERW
jgi:hypothetical protein